MGSGDAPSCSSCSSSPSRTSTWKCLSSSLSTECWISRLFLRGLVRTVQTVQKSGDSTGAVLLEVVETPADVSTTGVQKVCARVTRQWRHILCDSTLAVWHDFAYFLRLGGIRTLRSTSWSPLAAGAVCTVDASVVHSSCHRSRKSCW